MADTKFNPVWWWDIWEMRKQSNKIAEEEGMQGKGEKDSFRHPYTAAKIADEFKYRDLTNGKTISRGLGLLNEFGLGTSFEDHLVDLGNNEIGLKIRDEVDRDVKRMSEEWNLNEQQAEVWRERLLRTRISEAVKEGKLRQKF